MSEATKEFVRPTSIKLVLYATDPKIDLSRLKDNFRGDHRFNVTTFSEYDMLKDWLQRQTPADFGSQMIVALDPDKGRVQLDMLALRGDCVGLEKAHKLNIAWASPHASPDISYPVNALGDSMAYFRPSIGEDAYVGNRFLNIVSTLERCHYNNYPPYAGPPKAST